MKRHRPLADSALVVDSAKYLHLRHGQLLSLALLSGQNLKRIHSISLTIVSNSFFCVQTVEVLTP